MSGPPVRPHRSALPPQSSWQPLLELALGEDIGPGDVTTELVIARDRRGEARIEARQSLIVCGLDVAAAVFAQIDPSLGFEAAVRDGERAEAGQPLVALRGSLRAILTGERTALNFLGRMCGIATWTQRFVAAVAGTGAGIVDTRKTLPGWRVLDKYAVAVGGGHNHRIGLYDGILLKDNHVAAAGGVAAAVRQALASAPPNLRIQVEVESRDDAVAAVEAGAEFLLLDNCSADAMREIATQLSKRATLEATGGVQLDNVRAIAETGVHRISIGALTHSAASADVALEVVDGARSAPPR